MWARVPFEGITTLSLRNDRSVPCRPARQGPSSTLDTRWLYACFVRDTHNTSAHCAVSMPKSSAVASLALGAPSPT